MINELPDNEPKGLPKDSLKKRGKLTRPEYRKLRDEHSAKIETVIIDENEIFQAECACGWKGQCWDYFYEAKKELDEHNKDRRINRRDYKRGR